MYQGMSNVVNSFTLNRLLGVFDYSVSLARGAAAVLVRVVLNLPQCLSLSTRSIGEHELSIRLNKFRA